MIISYQNLGELDQVQKEFYWNTTISGSQAWLLANEPWNLIRDKLNIPREHKSKYDFLNSEKMKSISDVAKANGILYEKIVVEELKRTTPNNIISHNLSTFLFKVDVGVLQFDITSTPDYFILNEDGSIKCIGDIKCSTNGDNEKAMLERYYYQALHNCYCFGIYEFELTTKTMVSRPINIYHWTFSQEDFNQWENMLYIFYWCWNNSQYTYYDSGVPQIELKGGDEMSDKVLISSTYDANNDEHDNIVRLKELKETKSQVEKDIKTLEEYYKSNYENVLVNANDLILEQKCVIKSGGYDYNSLITYLKENNLIDDNLLNEFKKESIISKTITIKEKK